MGRDGGFPLPNADVAKQSPEVYKAQCAIWYQTTILGRPKKDVAADLDQEGNAGVRWLKTENEKGQRLPSGQLSKFMNAGDPAQSDCNNANKVDSVNTKEKAAHINLTFQADHAQAMARAKEQAQTQAHQGQAPAPAPAQAQAQAAAAAKRPSPPPEPPSPPPEPLSSSYDMSLLEAANAQVDAEAGPSPSIAVDARSASAPWSRLIPLPPHSDIGVIELRQKDFVLGKGIFKSTAPIRADARIRRAAPTI